MTPVCHTAQPELASLVSAARSGDSLAWARLVGRFDGMLRSVARSYRLSPQDVDDAVQATWVQLYEHVDSVRDTSAVAAWLATTVRRQSLHILQRRVREHLTDEPELLATAHSEAADETLLDGERRVVLSRALSTLPERQRKLMTLIASDTKPDYKQIGATLGIPVGSIGPTRARCMARLQLHSELREYAAAG
jgi:RNA polymerase sigma factor (sigma-70 family)